MRWRMDYLDGKALLTVTEDDPDRALEFRRAGETKWRPLTEPVELSPGLLVRAALTQEEGR